MLFFIFVSHGIFHRHHQVDSGSQAEAGGVQKGWCLQAVNSQAIEDEASFLALIQGLSSASFVFERTAAAVALPLPEPSSPVKPSISATAASPSSSFVPSPRPAIEVASSSPEKPAYGNSAARSIEVPPVSPVRPKEEHEEENDPLKQAVASYLTKAGLLPEVAATIADYVRNEFEADCAQDLAVLDQVLMSC